MLKVSHISKTFNPGTSSEKLAIDDLSLDVKKGDFITIIGANGAGKSTLFNAILGSFITDSGSIVLDGKDVTLDSMHVRARSIGVLFQDPMRGSAPGMTIGENLALAAGHGGWLSHVTKQEKEDFKERLSVLNMGLEDRMNQPVGLLSGGQRQALTLLMATINPPKPQEPKQPSLQERINAARKTSRTVTPPPQPKADPAHQKALERTLSNFASTSSKGVRIPSASSVPGVPSSQMNNYQRYVARCVTPMLANLWQTLGPNALNGNVPPVVIDFFVAPNGSVQSCVVTIRSDNAQMNAAAEALIRELTRKGLPPFSTVGLSTERNAGLPLNYTLEYTR